MRQAAFFAVLALPIFAAYLLDRLGQRLTRSSLSETLATDTRPYFLYLRGFDEDDLRVDESLGRRGFLELLAPFGRPRFEEVVVEHLTTAGPVIAISRGTSGLADLGAAKATLADDEWRDRVREWVGGARAVIMSATPSEVRAGLLWEVEHLAGREGVDQVGHFAAHAEAEHRLVAVGADHVLGEHQVRQVGLAYFLHQLFGVHFGVPLFVCFRLRGVDFEVTPSSAAGCFS